MNTIRGTLGQLDDRDGEVIGLIRCDEDNGLVFIHVPVDVTARLGGGLFVAGRKVELSGHMCDHERYLVVTDAKAGEDDVV